MMSDEIIKSCELLSSELYDIKSTKYRVDLTMSPTSKIENLPSTQKKASKNSVVNWSAVAKDLRSISVEFFKTDSSKVAIFSRSELIEIINKNANRKEEEYWSKTSKYALEKTSLKDTMSISQARYDGKFNELVKDNADFIRVNDGRRKYLGVKKVIKKTT